ncbi:hypothetical protein ACQ4M4_09210 [Leptolyngbya sp. AN02str]|uniref:hypothetical protein n=1 Tax=Leptolyngbya sp. AN02str TaxID=3423363 RepID=UPI003D31FDD3
MQGNVAQPERVLLRRVVVKVSLWAAWVGYVGYLLLSELPPGRSLLHTEPATLREALDLSLNFWFVMPLLFSQWSPSLNPALEGLFNLVVAWGLLFWGFAVDGRGQRLPIVPFLVGTAFLTNVFYLPWLALRHPNGDAVSLPLSRLERLGEGRGLPIALMGVAIASFVWAGVGRPEFGSLAQRWQSVVELVGSDRLAYSFVMDLLVFWVFQAALVGDDMARRGWKNQAMKWVVRLVPFVGLVLYLYQRPSLIAVEQFEKNCDQL